MPPRQPRAEAVQTERRRRNDGDLNKALHLKLAIPGHLRDDTTQVYRWINDENSRVRDLTVEDDWNICRTEDGREQISKVVGTKKDGSPLTAYLVGKRKDWFEEDRRQKSAHVAKAEKELFQAPPTDSADAAAHSYVAPGSSIRQGPYTP